MLYNHGWGGGIPADFDAIRYASVLGRIAIAWYLAALLVWYTTVRTQYAVTIGLLLGYWALQAWVSIGGYGGGDYTATGALNVWFDQHLLPGITYQNAPLDPEGILSNLGSIVNAVAGVFVGRWLKAYQDNPNKLLRILVGAGVACIAIAYLWHNVLPINKTLWTSSFAILTIGYSILLLALFYGVIDVLGINRWGQFFAIIGVNSIIIYLASALVNWQYTTQSLFGGVIQAFPTAYHALFTILFMVAVQWLILYWLFRHKIFIKV